MYFLIENIAGIPTLKKMLSLHPAISEFLNQLLMRRMNEQHYLVDLNKMFDRIYSTGWVRSNSYTHRNFVGASNLL